MHVLLITVSESTCEKRRQHSHPHIPILTPTSLLSANGKGNKIGKDPNPT